MSLRSLFDRIATSRVATVAPRPWMAVLLIGTAFAVAHGSRVEKNLPRRHWEDGRYFHHNREQIHSLADCFTKPSAWPGGDEASYRPISGNLYYFAGRTFFADKLAVYHAIDAGVYVLNGVLLFLVCRQLLPGVFSLIPPVLFVTRLAHGQVVTYTSEFAALSYVTFGLIGLALFVGARGGESSSRGVGAAVALAIALLCKEAAVAWPAVLTAYGWLFDRATAWRKYATVWVVTIAWALVHPFVIRSLYAADAPTFAFDLQPVHVLARYAAYLLCFMNVLVPRIDPESAGWSMPPRVVALSSTVPAVLVVASLLILEAAAVVCARFRPGSMKASARVAVFGFAWFLAATAPFVVLADRLFMRYSYLGHAGLAVTAGGIAAAVLNVPDAPRS